MNFQLGDKVRFLDDVGEGVVVGFKGDKELIIEHCSGFNIPMLRSECVLIVNKNPKDNKNLQIKESTISHPAIEYTQSSDEKSSACFRVSLAFVPLEINNIEKSPLRLYLINESGYTLWANISTQLALGECKSLLAKQLQANEILLVKEFSRLELSLLETLRVQIIAHKSIGIYRAQEPIDRTIKTHITKFSRKGCFSPNKLLGCDAMTVLLTSKETQQTQSQELLEKLKNSFSEQKSRSIKKQKTPSSSTLPQTKEIDLHIDKLLDSTAGMSSGDILEYQLDYLRSTISRYSQFRGLKLIFIHGKGDGVLRQSICRELKKMGLAGKYQEASFKKYGSGALLLRL